MRHPARQLLQGVADPVHAGEELEQQRLLRRAVAEVGVDRAGDRVAVVEQHALQGAQPLAPLVQARVGRCEVRGALAGEHELNVTFSADPAGVAGDTMRLPQISRRMGRDEVLLARGTADALAMRMRHHDASTHARYSPAGPMARELYEALETARCEALGARDMPGALSNIDAKIGAEPIGWARHAGRTEIVELLERAARS